MSKELKALKSIEKELAECYGTDVAYYPDTFDNFQIIARSLRAVEIVRNKLVNVQALIHSCNLEEYNVLYIKALQLTQEEYQLLKEVLL